jgi:hypothetical protein
MHLIALLLPFLPSWVENDPLNWSPNQSWQVHIFLDQGTFLLRGK